MGSSTECRRQCCGVVQSTEPTIPSAGREELPVQCYICALPSFVVTIVDSWDGAVTIFDRGWCRGG